MATLHVIEARSCWTTGSESLSAGFALPGGDSEFQGEDQVHVGACIRRYIMDTQQVLGKGRLT